MPVVRVWFITQLAGIILNIGLVPTGTSPRLWSAAVISVTARPTMPGVGSTALRIGESLLRPLHVRVDGEEREDSCC